MNEMETKYIDEHGKLTEVSFDDIVGIRNLTGEKIICQHEFIVWTDEGLLDLIKSVIGVYDVQQRIGFSKNQYFVFVDWRYDIEFIKKEIEAVILCRDI
jgi:hypothetical protein